MTVFLFACAYVLGFLSGIGFGLFALSRLLPLPLPSKESDG